VTALAGVAVVAVAGGLASPFAGLPVGWQGVFVLALVVVVGMFAWTLNLYVRGARWVAAERRRATRAGGTDGGGEVATTADDLLWIFLVPALDEAVTIADSVARLAEVDVRARRIVVIDDGSGDATPQVLAGIDYPDLRVIRRDLPEARRGKAAALNQAYRDLDVAGWSREHVVVGIVDADGRLAADAPRHIAHHFSDPRVGGVQARVRIYNRRRLLAWFQDVEFGVYGHLHQAGRNRVGTAGMGGNGQFNRLSALDDLVEGEGPWRDRLTEDQDLGLRLSERGWKGRQDLHATVEQQGLSRLRPLLRQRTRWSQGNLQALGLAGAVARAPFGRIARVELLLHLGLPFIQGMIGMVLICALVLAATGVAPWWGDGPTWYLAVAYLLAFGGTILGCVAARRDDGIRGRLVGFFIGHAYAFYSWLLWPVLLGATLRQFRRRRDWSKTAREPLETRDDVMV
jgi:1,2-diacylglycerol 3-beta-glucosyltransferase